MKRALLIVAAVTGMASASPCPQFVAHARTLTPDHALVDRDAGIVVLDAWDATYQPAKPHDYAAAIADWHFADAAKTPVVATTIAPGLYVLRAGAAKDLVDRSGTHVLTIASGPSGTRVTARLIHCA